MTLCPKDYTRDGNALLALGLRPTTGKWMGNARKSNTERSHNFMNTKHLFTSIFAHINIIAEYISIAQQ